MSRSQRSRILLQAMRDRSSLAETGRWFSSSSAQSPHPVSLASVIAKHHVPQLESSISSQRRQDPRRRGSARRGSAPRTSCTSSGFERRGSAHAAPRALDRERANPVRRVRTARGATCPRALTLADFKRNRPATRSTLARDPSRGTHSRRCLIPSRDPDSLLRDNRLGALLLGEPRREHSASEGSRHYRERPPRRRQHRQHRRRRFHDRI